MKEKYCVRCGKKNDHKRKRCKKCFRKLEPKEHLLIDYFIGKGLGKTEDTFWKNFKKFVIHYLYGFVMTCSILVTTISVIANVSSQNSESSYIKIVTEKPNVTKIEEPFDEEEQENRKFFNTVFEYVEALEKGDTELAKTYLLENNDLEAFHKMGWTEGEGYLVIERAKDLSLMNIEEDYSYKKVEIHDGSYPYTNYRILYGYCSFNQCKTVDGKPQADFQVGFQAPVVKVGEKYYIGKETIKYEVVGGNTILEILLSQNGDTSNINFDGLLGRYDKCMLENGDKEYCTKVSLH